ncbi:MAG: serpin family protein [Candidatus Omnitrophica bacterium]|nr:serpin family protein [Candidatus Omnitrophota bacterium]
MKVLNGAIGCLCVLIYLTTAGWSAEGISSVVKGNNDLALELYAILDAKPEPGASGSVFAPYAIAKSLAMVYSGAKENTALQMVQAMHMKIGSERFHKAFASLSASLESSAVSTGYDLAGFNALFVQEGYSFQKEFLIVQDNVYGILPVGLDFASSPQAQRTAINRRLEGETNNMIKGFLEPGMVTDTTRMLLVSAMYFKGQWESAFDPALTFKADFVRPAGLPTSRAMFMTTNAEFRYGEDSETQLLELPYIGRKFSMLIILPRVASAFSVLEKNLTPASFEQYLTKLRLRKIHVEIPRFKAETTLRLNSALQALGVTDAFDDSRADFSGMDGNRDLYISQVLHKACVEVDEGGPDAGALARHAAADRAAQLPVFRADHPFLFMVRDNATGSILFLGRVIDPGLGNL